MLKLKTKTIISSSYCRAHKPHLSQHDQDFYTAILRENFTPCEQHDFIRLLYKQFTPVQYYNIGMVWLTAAG